jgi:hypothetical protein
LNFNPLDFLIGALAVWRISAMLAYERGPFKLFDWIRAKATGEFAELILCVWCLSLWFAGLWVLGYSFFPTPTMIVSTVLAISAGAIVVEKINNG